MARIINPLDYMIQILAELNAEGDSTLELIFPFYWETNADKGADAVRYLYCKRNVIDYLMGRQETRTSTDTKEGDEEVTGTQFITNLQTMRDNVTAEILRYSGNLTVSIPISTLTNPFISTTSGEFG